MAGAGPVLPPADASVIAVALAKQTIGFAHEESAIAGANRFAIFAGSAFGLNLAASLHTRFGIEAAHGARCRGKDGLGARSGCDSSCRSEQQFDEQQGSADAHSIHSFTHWGDKRSED